jgi:hypothetical protein
MKVTLKKASALAIALSGANIPLNHSFNVDIFSDGIDTSVLERLTGELVSQCTKAMLATEAVFKIRSLVAEANYPVIHNLLTTRAMIDKKLSILKQIPIREAGSNLASIARQVEAARTSDTVRTFGANKVTLELETASIVTGEIKSLKKQRIKVEDELAHLNFSTTIELPEDVVKLLTEFDLI